MFWKEIQRGEKEYPPLLAHIWGNCWVNNWITGECAWLVTKAKRRVVVRAEKLTGTLELDIKGCRSWSERERTPGPRAGWLNPQQGLKLRRSIVAEELGKSQNRRAIGS